MNRSAWEEMNNLSFGAVSKSKVQLGELCHQSSRSIYSTHFSFSETSTASAMEIPPLSRVVKYHQAKKHFFSIVWSLGFFSKTKGNKIRQGSEIIWIYLQEVWTFCILGLFYSVLLQDSDTQTGWFVWEPSSHQPTKRLWKRKRFSWVLEYGL